jgi:hypothetical protein
MEMSGRETQDLRPPVIDLCERALRGELSLEDLQQLWPAEAMDDTFLAQVYTDIEDGVEHLPGFAFRAGIDRQAWLKSEMYWLIYLDCVLLAQDAPNPRLLECRHAIGSREYAMKQRCEPQ